MLRQLLHDRLDDMILNAMVEGDFQLVGLNNADGFEWRTAH